MSRQNSYFWNDRFLLFLKCSLNVSDFLASRRSCWRTSRRHSSTFKKLWSISFLQTRSSLDIPLIQIFALCRLAQNLEMWQAGVHFMKLKRHFWCLKHQIWHFKCQNMGVLNALFFGGYAGKLESYGCDEWNTRSIYDLHYAGFRVR